MSLPTVQPVDWPDWGNNATFTTSSYSVVGVAGPNEVLAEVTTGYYSHALVIFYPSFPLETFSVSLEQWTAGASEGGSLLFAQQTILAADHTVVIPMTNVGPSIRIVSVAATAYPHSAVFSITLFSAAGYMTGWPGGIFAVNETASLAATDAYDFIPLGCGPGRHAISVDTNAADWTLGLYIWNEVGSFHGSIIATDATTELWDIEFIAPATSWILQFSNNDATPSDATVIVTRQPS